MSTVPLRIGVLGAARIAPMALLNPARVCSSIKIGWPRTFVWASRWAARLTVSPTHV